MYFLFLLFSVLSIIFIVIIIGMSVSKKISYDREKMSPFECGFTPKYNARMSFSLRFFLICLIFLVFDVELVLMFPYIMSLNMANSILTTVYMYMFIIILALGLFHEWNQNSLDWSM